MRVDLHPADLGGCGHYRMIWPALAVREQFNDIQVRISDVTTDQQTPDYYPDHADRLPMALMDDADGTAHVVGMDPAYTDWPDVIVLQRPLRRLLAEAIPHLQRSGIKVIVEIDDDFSSIHPSNVAHTHANPKTNPDRNFRWLERSCANADLVITTTEALRQRYGTHGRCVVIPNYVPEDYLKMPRPEPHDTVNIGWSGSIATHPTDLQELGASVKGLLAQNESVRLGVVGTGKGVAERLSVKPDQIVSSGWLKLREYPLTLAQLDLGLVPLARIMFNEAKSWLKGLEMAALGVPFVATPTQPYQALHGLGIGTLAHKPQIWLRELQRYVRNPNLIDIESFRGRERVRAEDLTIESRASAWHGAWRGVKSLQC